MFTKEILDDYVARDLLYVQHHPHRPLSVYNYSQKVQFENLWDDVTLACRGKIFDSSGLEVTRPLRKFFNIEEKRYKSTDHWEVLEKIDGSFISLHKYQGQLIVASRGSFTSDHVGWAKQVLADIEKETGYIVLNNLRDGWTYCLELIWPENRIVVDYGDRKDLVLLAIIDEKGIELPYRGTSHSSGYCLLDYSSLFTIVKRFDGIKDFTKIQELNTHNAEGFVVRFSNGDRVKIKFADYVRMHHLCTELSTIRVYEALKAGTLNKWIENIPDEFYNRIKGYADELQTKYDKIEQDAKSIYNAIEHIANRKKFAEQVISTEKKFHSILFSMRDNADYSKTIFKLIEPGYKKL